MMQDESYEEIKDLLSLTQASLPVHSPVGRNGDTLLELQVRYANDATVRQRIVIDAIREPVGKKKYQQTHWERRQHAQDFLKLATQAAASGDQHLALQALEQLALVDSFRSEPLFFSVAPARAQVALVGLKNPTACREAQRSLQELLKWRTWVISFILALPIVGSLGVGIYERY